MEIADNARKHGVADEEIEHTVRNAIGVIAQGDRDLYIGADRTGPGSSRLSFSTTTASRWRSTPWHSDPRSTSTYRGDGHAPNP